MSPKELDDIKILISKGQTSLAINKLRILSLPRRKENQLILIAARLEMLNTKNREGLIEVEKYLIEKSRINKSLLELVVNPPINKSELNHVVRFSKREIILSILVASLSVLISKYFTEREYMENYIHKRHLKYEFLERSEGLQVILDKSSNKYGFQKENSYKIVISPQFDFVSKFKNGLSVVKKDRKMGVIDTTGNTYIDYVFDTICPIENTYLRVKQNDKWGFLNPPDTTILFHQFDFVEDFSEGFAAIRMDQKWGFIDTLGNYFILPTWDYVRPFGPDKKANLVRIKSDNSEDNKIYIINLSGCTHPTPDTCFVNKEWKRLADSK